MCCACPTTWIGLRGNAKQEPAVVLRSVNSGSIVVMLVRLCSIGTVWSTPGSIPEDMPQRCVTALSSWHCCHACESLQNQYCVVNSGVNSGRYNTAHVTALTSCICVLKWFQWDSLPVSQAKACQDANYSPTLLQAQRAQWCLHTGVTHDQTG